MVNLITLYAFIMLTNQANVTQETSGLPSCLGCPAWMDSRVVLKLLF